MAEGNGIRLTLKDVRIAFVDLHEKGKSMQQADGRMSEAKYGANFIMAPDSEAAKLSMKALADIATGMWKENAKAVMGALSKEKKFLRRGDQNLMKDGTVRNGFAGMLYVVAKNKIQPSIVGRHIDPATGKLVKLTKESGKPYGGCYVNATIEVYGMDKPGMGKSINATLLGVQYLRDGEAFGGGQPTEEGFEALDETPEMGSGAAGDAFGEDDIPF